MQTDANLKNIIIDKKRVKDISKIHITLNNLTKRFIAPKQTVTAFENINVEIKQGEFVALLGPSGCGKSSLLRVIAGLDVQTQGDIKIEKNIQGEKSEVAMIFQEHGLFPWMSLRKNIEFILENNPKFTSEQVTSISDLYLQKVGLVKHADMFPHEVSGGMKQRISIARSFANNPDILLMDEPFVFLDFQTRMLLHELLLTIWQETEKTILFVTHDVEEAVLLADRVLVLSAHPGKILNIEQVNISRPRDLGELRKTPAFFDQVSRLTHEIKAVIKT